MTAIVQGFVQVVGSSTVTSTRTVSGSTRVYRSIKWSVDDDLRKVVFSLKLVTSTTRVLPSHRPRESPNPLPNPRLEVRTAIQRNHARLVQPLVPDGDRICRLHDLKAVVVLARKPGLRQAAGDAPIGERQVLGTVVGARSEAPPTKPSSVPFFTTRFSASGV